MTTDRASARRSLIGRCLACTCALTLLLSVGCAKKATTAPAAATAKEAAPNKPAETKPAPKSEKSSDQK